MNDVGVVVIAPCIDFIIYVGEGKNISRSFLLLYVGIYVQVFSWYVCRVDPAVKISRKNKDIGPDKNDNENNADDVFRFLSKCPPGNREYGEKYRDENAGESCKAPKE